MTADDLGESEVRGCHGDFLVGWIDVGGFEDVGCVVAAHYCG